MSRFNEKNKVCATCTKSCKQSNHVTIQRCPNYVAKPVEVKPAETPK